MKSRSGHIDRLRRMHLPSPGKAQDIGRHHKLITRAIAAGEADEAQRHLRTHLSGTLSELAEIRTRYPEYPQRLTAGIAVEFRNHPATMSARHDADGPTSGYALPDRTEPS